MNSIPKYGIIYYKIRTMDGFHPENKSIPKVYGICGLPGSGKTTAIEILKQMGFEHAYVGGIVVAQVKIENNGNTSPHLEAEMRRRLRAEGIDALARRIIPTVRNYVDNGRDVLIDGPYSMEDVMVYKINFPNYQTIALIAEDSIRKSRLASREDRPLFPEEVDLRDQQELALGKGLLMENAEIKIDNNGSVDNLRTSLVSALYLDTGE
jgi:dephospho-CoA kinase